jgi:ubiquinone/menaquinone biosynthesis C-methylase UbiE
MSIDLQELRGYISAMYSDVARYPRGEFHFPTGRSIMERLGYAPEILDRIPGGALESFAGVGHHFGLAPLRPGETVLDLGSGAGSDVFHAALQVGPTGRAIGVDMTESMLDKARAALAAFPLDNVEFVAGHIEDLPFADGTFDCVISNGVINLVVDKAAVFASIFRVLKPGGRLMFSDIVTGVELPRSVRENCELWAECIGGALEQQQYLDEIGRSGLRVETFQVNHAYGFTRDSTLSAARKFQVRCLSMLAYRPS